MVERGSGVVVHVSSIAGHLPQPGQAGYAAAKAAPNSYSRSLAAEVGPAGWCRSGRAGSSVPSSASTDRRRRGGVPAAGGVGDSRPCRRRGVCRIPRGAGAGRRRHSGSVRGRCRGEWPGVPEHSGRTGNHALARDPGLRARRPAVRRCRATVARPPSGLNR
ncbi:SDR family NAD(P)-dependent oxidoreductase [Streptomyces javensis]|uniref:SDR family NAD(P)-dependent oxidoreductase n=1 Tax=Streptomyces javensis TaxID=114698 RepID=UPI003D15E915